MKLLLECDGHRVDVAANGREAVEVATMHVPDVVVMDLNMPVMDGVSAARVLRQHPATSTRCPADSRSSFIVDRTSGSSSAIRMCMRSPTRRCARLPFPAP